MTEAAKGESLSNVIDITGLIDKNNKKTNVGLCVSGDITNLDSSVNSEEGDYEGSDDAKIDKILNNQENNVSNIEEYRRLLDRFRKTKINKNTEKNFFRGEEEF